MSILLYNSIMILFKVIEILILIRVLISWLPMGDNSIIRFIYGLTDPLLQPIRELIRKSPLGDGMMIDFSPIILFLILGIIKSVLFSFLL